MSVTNLVGTAVPTEEQLNEILSDIDKTYLSLSSFGVTLPPEERNSFLKPRIGIEKLIPLVIQLASEKKLDIPDMPVSELNNDLQVGNAAMRIEQKVANCHQLISDTRLAAFGEAYRAFLGYYAILSTMATRDPALAERLRPVADFMARSPRLKKAEKPADK